MKNHILESQTMEWLVRSSTEAIIIVEAAGRIVLGNAASARLFGRTQEELNGLEVTTLLPSLYQVADTAAADAPGVRMAGVFEAAGRRPDRSEFPVEICLSPLKTHWGLDLLMVTIRDVTLRRRTEQAVRDSEARLRAVFETAVDAIVTIDDRGLIERFNASAVRLFGYTEREVLGRNVSMLMPSPYRERHDGYLSHYLRTGEKKIIGVGREVVGMRKDGTVFPMDLAVAEMNVDGRRMFTGMVRDITARKQAEAMFRTLVEQIQAISYIRELGDPHRLRYISPQIQTLGYPPEQWLADPAFRLRCIHPADRARAAAAIVRSAADGSSLHLDYRVIGKDGRQRWFRDEAEVVHDEQGRKLFVQGILVDITQNKLNEAALRDSRETLRRLAAHQESIKENERKRIAQEIHDELGGLLTGIKAHVSVSAERAERAGAPADPLLAEAGRLTEEAIQAVRRVINDLRPSVLDQLGVWEAIGWHANQVEARFGVACDCQVAASAAAVRLDPDRSITLFRIVQESLTNVVRHADASLVTVQAAVHDGVVMVEICDDGKGFMAPRCADGHSWGIQGMQERARHFGGQLTVSSVAGKGTRVALRMPVGDGGTAPP